MGLGSRRKATSIQMKSGPSMKDWMRASSSAAWVRVRLRGKVRLRLGLRLGVRVGVRGEG